MDIKIDIYVQQNRFLQDGIKECIIQIKAY